MLITRYEWDGWLANGGPVARIITQTENIQPETLIRGVSRFIQYPVLDRRLIKITRRAINKYEDPALPGTCTWVDARGWKGMATPTVLDPPSA